jgi:4-hydroxy-tetrahydrodipicolinate synthase
VSRPHIMPQLLTGVWSATPTAFTEKLKVDISSTKRMVEHHFQLGVKGLFLAGTCGEGPWMPEREKRLLVQTVARHARGRMAVAVQVSDNSADRVLDNIQGAKEDGAEIAIIAPPYFLLNATPENILRFYQRAIRESPLPVGLYHLVRSGSVIVPEAILRKILEEKNLVMVKDSSAVAAHRRIMVAAKRKRPELVLLSGDEFDCVEYIKAGYDGLLLGGAILTAHLARRLMDAAAVGDLDEAREIERQMHQILVAVYGGKLLGCWLSGLKWTLVQMGVFQTWGSFLNYPLTPSCIKGIRRVLEKHADVLMPWNPRALAENLKKAPKHKAE